MLCVVSVDERLGMMSEYEEKEKRRCLRFYNALYGEWNGEIWKCTETNVKEANKVGLSGGVRSWYKECDA